MNRTREVALLTIRDSLLLAQRFPRAACNLLRDAISRSPATPFPRRIGLFITNRCDFSCPMCAVLDVRTEGLQTRSGDMPFELIERLFDEASPHQPTVDLVGGEPLLYPRLADAIQLAQRKKILAAVTTNGLKLKENAEALVRAGLPLLQVSLDGWDEASQQARGRVPDSFRNLCEGVRAIQKAKGNRAFPILRILTSVTRTNHAHLDRIQHIIHSLNVKNWGISNYLYLNRTAHRKHLEFALFHGLPGHATAHSIEDDSYLSPEQVRELRGSLARIRRQNRLFRLKIGYAWDIDLEQYYSSESASRSSSCALPYNRLDIHTDGSIRVCVSGKRLGNALLESINAVWTGASIQDYRAMYRREKPMPMCFRCCGISQSIRFDTAPQISPRP